MGSIEKHEALQRRCRSGEKQNGEVNVERRETEMMCERVDVKKKEKRQRERETKETKERRAKDKLFDLEADGCLLARSPS